SRASLNVQTSIDPDQLFNKSDVMVPMRDVAKLHTLIYAPKNQTEPLPFVFLRTPYGIDDPPEPLFNSYCKELADGINGHVADGREAQGASFKVCRHPLCLCWCGCALDSLRRCSARWSVRQL